MKVKKLIRPEVKVVSVQKLDRTTVKKSVKRYSIGEWACILRMQQEEKLSDKGAAIEVGMSAATVAKRRREALLPVVDGCRGRLEWPLGQSCAQQGILDRFQDFSEYLSSGCQEVTNFLEAFNISSALLEWWHLKHKNKIYRPVQNANVINDESLLSGMRVYHVLADSYSKTELKFLGIPLNNSKACGFYVPASGKLYGAFVGKPYVCEVVLKWTNSVQLYSVGVFQAWLKMREKDEVEWLQLKSENTAVYNVLRKKRYQLECLFGEKGLQGNCQEWIREQLDSDALLFNSFTLRVLSELAELCSEIDLDFLMRFELIGHFLDADQRYSFLNSLQGAKSYVAKKVFVSCSYLTGEQLSNLCVILSQHHEISIPISTREWLEHRGSVGINDKEAFNAKFTDVISLVHGELVPVSNEELKCLKRGVAVDHYRIDEKTKNKRRL